MIQIAPSLLSVDLMRLDEQIGAMEAAPADLLHLDVMDGHFVPNLTYGAGFVKALRKRTDLKLDCHLMVSRPEDHVDAFLQAGADIISVHLEATHHPDRLLQRIQEGGAKAALALNPATDIGPLMHLLDRLDMVLLMSVNPGFGGQSFHRPILKKIKDLSIRFQQAGVDIPIQVDGGVDATTAAECVANGARVLVSGSYLFKQDDLSKAIRDLRHGAQA
jgi:ribulose-phosphate 3-epimerase